MTLDWTCFRSLILSSLSFDRHLRFQTFLRCRVERRLQKLEEIFGLKQLDQLDVFDQDSQNKRKVNNKVACSRLRCYEHSVLDPRPLLASLASIPSSATDARFVYSDNQSNLEDVCCSPQNLAPWNACVLPWIFPPMCACVYSCNPWSGWLPGSLPAGSDKGQLIAGPTRNTRPAAVGDGGGRLICLFCPLKIVVHCQLKSSVQFLCLGGGTPTTLVGQLASLFRATSPVGREPALTREYTSFWLVILVMPSCWFNVSAVLRVFLLASHEPGISLSFVMFCNISLSRIVYRVRGKLKPSEW